MGVSAKSGFDNYQMLHSLIPNGHSGSTIDSVAFGNSSIHVFGDEAAVRNNWSAQTILNDGVSLDLRSIGISAHETVPRSKMVGAF